MQLVILMLTLQWGVVAASLLVGEREPGPHARPIRLFGAASMALMLVSAWIILREARAFFPALGHPVQFMVPLGLAYALLMAPLLRTGPAPAGRARRILRVIVSMTIMGLQGVLLGVGIYLLAGVFRVYYLQFGLVEHYLTFERLALMLGLGLGSASLLLLTVTQGLMRLWLGRGMPDGRGQGAVRVALFWIGMLLVARLAALGVVFWISALGHPISAGFFLEGLLDGASTIVAMRLVVGLALPLLVIVSILADLARGRPRQAALQFFPLFILVVTGEVLAVGLTVGARGIVF